MLFKLVPKGQGFSKRGVAAAEGRDLPTESTSQLLPCPARWRSLSACQTRMQLHGAAARSFSPLLGLQEKLAADGQPNFHSLISGAQHVQARAVCLASLKQNPSQLVAGQRCA